MSDSTPWHVSVADDAQDDKLCAWVEENNVSLVAFIANVPEADVTIEATRRGTPLSGGSRIGEKRRSPAGYVPVCVWWRAAVDERYRKIPHGCCASTMGWAQLGTWNGVCAYKVDEAGNLSAPTMHVYTRDLTSLYAKVKEGAAPTDEDLIEKTGAISGVMGFLVKPHLQSVGNVIREINYYKSAVGLAELDAPDNISRQGSQEKWVIVCPDGAQALTIRRQDIGFVCCEQSPPYARPNLHCGFL
jgi:hypothetical protein